MRVVTIVIPEELAIKKPKKELLEIIEIEKLYKVKVLVVPADVNAGADNEAVVNHVVEETMKEFGRIDVLINNAQASASGVTLADHTTDQFNLAMYSGLYATFYYMKACYPHLKETKGTVINFASGAGLFGNFGQCSYAAAKEGIRGMSRVAATEWGKDGINVNIICPLAWTAQLENFEKAYPEAICSLIADNPFELLVATRLSAQCTAQKFYEKLGYEIFNKDALEQWNIKDILDDIDHEASLFRNKYDINFVRNEMIAGEDTDANEVEEIEEYVNSKYDVEIETHFGGQAVYSWIIGVE